VAQPVLDFIGRAFPAEVRRNQRLDVLALLRMD
jgi:hypothetical protein